MINVLVNGDEKEFADGTTISSLLIFLGVKKQRVAVAVNGQVVTKSEHGTFVLSEGDRIEVVRMVGGG